MRRAGLLPVLLLAASLGCREAPAPGVTPTPRPSPSVHARPLELRTLPEAEPAVVEAVANELSAFLTELYARAFLPPLPAPRARRLRRPPPTPTPRPTPVPRPPVQELFTDPARAAVEGQLDAFRAGDGVRVQRGDLRYRGVVTLEGATATSALLAVEFSATGTLRPPPDGPLGPRPRQLRLQQSGQLLLVRTDAGWRVGGFEVELRAEREVLGSPPPSPRAVARWMPS